MPSTDSHRRGQLTQGATSQGKSTENLLSSNSSTNRVKTSELESLARIARTTNQSDTKKIVVDEILRAAGYTKLDQNSGSSFDRTIKQHLYAETPWEMLKNEIWSQFLKDPSDHNASKLVELTAACTNHHQTLDIVKRLFLLGKKDFYWDVHFKVRDLLVENADSATLDQIANLLLSSKVASPVSATERLLVYLHLKQNSLKAHEAYRYFNNHHQEIISLISDKPKLAQTFETLIVDQIELCVALNKIQEAKELSQKIPERSELKSRIFELIYEAEQSIISQNSFASTQNIFESYLGSKTDLEREGIVLSWSLHLESNPTSREHIEKYKQPLIAFISNPTNGWMDASNAMKVFSEVFLRCLLSPHLQRQSFEILEKHAYVFGSDWIWNFLWERLKQETIKENYPSKDQLISMSAFVAGLHVWLEKKTVDELDFEHLLWIRSVTLSQVLEPIKRCFESAHVYLSSNLFPFQTTKKIRQKCLVVLTNHPFCDAATLESIAVELPYPSEGLLRQLKDHLLLRNERICAQTIYQFLASRYALTNSDLNDLWKLSCSVKNYDLAWRCATLANCRTTLDSTIVKPWEISGENRKSYVPRRLQNEDFAILVENMNIDQRKLIQCLIVLREDIQRLSKILFSGEVKTSKPLDAANEWEKLVRNCVYETKSFTPLKEVIHLTQELKSKSHHKSDSLDNSDQILARQVSPSLESLVTHRSINPWLFVFRLVVEQFGASAWGYSRETLLFMIQEVSMHSGRVFSTHSAAKLSKWYGGLSGTSRACWIDLTALSKSLNQSQIEHAILVSGSILATLLYPSHSLMVQSLMRSNVDLNIIRKLEGFVLSANLDKIRQKFGQKTKVAVPQTLASKDICKVTTSKQNSIAEIDASVKGLPDPRLNLGL
jgi:hypothetical protein